VDRTIRLDGCLNFRDLGGYPTEDGREIRWRQLFRSDALHLLTPADVACIRDQLAIGDVIDLRSSGEVRAQGQNHLAAEPIRFHHLPLFDGDVKANENQRPAGKNLADLYMMMAEIGREIARAHAIGRIGMIHRLGRLEIGEASVVIVAAAPHRKPAFEAALEGINKLKKLVPIWKKEYFADGEVWVDGEWDDKVIKAAN